LLDGFAAGEIRLGAKTRKGLGKGRISAWNIREFETANAAHFNAWLDRRFDHGKPLTIRDLAPAQPQSLRRVMTIDAAFRLKTSLLIRTAGDQAGAPDQVHLTENGSPVVSGTSLAGVLRHRAERIARTMLSSDDAVSLIERMFGPLKRENGEKWDPRAGDVTVEESILDSSAFETLVQGRVAIDRFTGGALQQHLFDEGVLYPRAGNLSVMKARISLDLPDPGADAADANCCMALLLHCVKDLWTGDLAIGGEIGCGRGVWQGICADITAPGLPPLGITQSDPSSASGLTLNCQDLEPWRKLGRALQASAGKPGAGSKDDPAK
jgi:hypothetical protein